MKTLRKWKCLDCEVVWAGEPEDPCWICEGTSTKTVGAFMSSPFSMTFIDDGREYVS